MRRLFVAFAFLAAVGISEASDRRDSPVRADVQCSGTPTLPDTFVAPTATPAPSWGSVATPASADLFLEPVAALSAPAKVDRRVFLVDAQVLEKYLAFRESLTSP